MREKSASKLGKLKSALLIIFFIAPLQGQAQGGPSVSRMGALQYSIPLPTPVTVAALTPQIYLQYDAQGGNGIAGVGWSLGGLSNISRCASHPGIDQSRRGVMNDSLDKFCLNGQKLIAVKGAYGADGTEYRTESDDYTSITSYGVLGTAPNVAPKYFVVKMRDGRAMEFGGTEDSSPVFGGTAKGNGVPRGWALSKVADENQNYARYSYTGNPTNISRIEYAGNTRTSAGATFALDFVYETRPDASRSYTGGRIISSGTRLSKIAVSTIKRDLSGWESLRETRLIYEAAMSAATSRSRLKEIARCESTPTGPYCLPNLKLTWSGAAPQFSGIQLALPFKVPENSQVVSGDINADGRSDFVIINGTDYTSVQMLAGGQTKMVTGKFPNAWSFSQSPKYQIQTGDFNGDGQTDFMMVGDNAYYMFWSNGDGTFASKSGVSGTPLPSSLNVGLPAKGFASAAADFNYDGLQDFVEFGFSGTSYIFLNNGDGSFTSSQFATNLIADGAAAEGGSIWSTVGVQVGDFEGDGRLDLLVGYSCRSGDVDCYFGDAMYYGGTKDNRLEAVQNSVIVVLVASKADENTYPYVRACNGRSPPYASVIDFNGDGLPDCPVFVQTFETPAIGGLLNKGNTEATTDYYTGPSLSYTLSNDKFNWPSTSYKYLRGMFGDFNGDGTVDMLEIQDNKIRPWWATEFGRYVIGSPMSLPNGWDLSAAASNGFLNAQTVDGDFNGDGRADFALIVGSNVYVVYAGGPTPDLLVRVESDADPGRKTEFEYTSLPEARDLGVYVQEVNSSYPMVAVTPAGMHVVSRVSRVDPSGAVARTSYKYGSAMSDSGAMGRGFLGFQWMSELDSVSGLSKRTYYRQDHPYIGMIDKVGRGTSEANWSNLGQTTYKYTFNSFGPTDADYANPVTCVDDPATGRPLKSCTDSAIKPGNRYVAYAHEVLDKSWDWNDQTNVFIALPQMQTTTVQDNWGNATQIKVGVLKADGTASGYSKTTSTVFAEPDKVNWRIGRVIKSTVTSTAP